MGAIPVVAEAAPWSLRSLRAASATTGILSAKADTPICCQHLIARPDALSYLRPDQRSSNRAFEIIQPKLRQMKVSPQAV